MRHIGIVAVIVCALAVATATPASAEFLEIGQLSNNSGLDLSSQFSIELTENSDEDGVIFEFQNAATIESSITRVYFASDLSSLLSFPAASEIESDTDDVSFSPPAPGGTPGYVNDWTSVGYSTQEDQNGITYGIDASGEWLRVEFDYAGTTGFADVLGAFGGSSTLGGYGLAFHVQNIDGNDGDSDGYGVVPEPTSIALFGLGAAGLVALRRRRRA